MFNNSSDFLFDNISQFWKVFFFFEKRFGDIKYIKKEMIWADLVVPESFHLLLIGCLSHLEDQRGLAKPEILRGDVAVQEDVDACNQTENQSVVIGCGSSVLMYFVSF